MSFKTTVDLFEGAGGKPVSCRICGGELIPAFGSRSSRGTLPGEILTVQYSDIAEHFFLCNSTQIFGSDNGINYYVVTEASGNYPFIIQDVKDEKGRLIAVNGGTVIFHINGKNDPYYLHEKLLCCAVMHCGRVFGADLDNKYLLRWSAKDGILNWKHSINEGGSLMLDPERGEVLNILEFGEKLVAVRRFGLTLINAFGSPENFSVDITETDTDEIYAKTAQVVGSMLLFCTKTGLYSFDGSKITKLPHRYTRDISEPSNSAVYGHNYLLCCKSTTLNRNGILCYHTEDGDSYLIDVPAKAICPTPDKLYAYGTLVYTLTEGSYTYTKAIDFGTWRKKTITKMFIDGVADVQINNGKYTRRYSSVSGLIRPRMRGQSFTVKVTGTQPVYRLTLTAEECNAI